MIHVVEQGECLLSLAARFGFADWRTIYGAAENEALRKARPNGDLLHPGDEVFVPELPKNSDACESDQVHTFTVKRPKVKLRVTLLDDQDAPIADKRFVIEAEGFRREGRTTAEGLIDERVPARLSSCELFVFLDDDDVADMEYTLQIGHLDPVETPSGVEARLHNLGYRGDLAACMRAFRADRGLAEHEGIDQALVDALRGRHDGG
jgi:hypothetical protein